MNRLATPSNDIRSHTALAVRVSPREAGASHSPVAYGQTVGMAWTDEAEAGVAVLRPHGHEARRVIGGGVGHCAGSLPLTMG